MTDPVRYLDRRTGEIKEEKIYGEWALRFLYGSHFLSRFFCGLIAYLPLFSRLYGWWQKQSWTRKKVTPFIKEFGVDTSEFLTQDFGSFNDFFIRKLKPDARPLAKSEAVMPADGRYLFYPDLSAAERFEVKGRHFSASQLIGEPWEGGSMVCVRLCPTDYHRFHFPCSGIPSKSRLINGPLFSVNPLAVKLRPSILCENKRVVTELQSEAFGRVLIVEIGATNVGSIHQVYTPEKKVEKGDEKGFFSFGGSAIALLFEPKRISFEKDLVSNGTEILCFTKSALGQKNSFSY